MQLYANNIQDKYGTAMAGASVQITLAAGGALPPLYSDNGITPTANPIIADEEGEVAFYAANGRYTLTATGTGIRTAIVRNFELADGLEVVDAVTALAGGATADAAATASDRAQTGEDRIAVNADKLAAVDAASAAEISAAAALDRSLDAALSEYNAGQSANSAAELLDDFKGRYYGALAADPVLDPLGNAVSTGDMYYNTALQYLKIYGGVTWERPAYEATAVAAINAAVAAVDSSRVTALTDITADVTAVDASRIASQTLMTADVDAVDASRVTAQAAMTVAATTVTASAAAATVTINGVTYTAGSAAAAAAASAASAAAVVTGGTGSLVPTAGKLPIADSYGHIPFSWARPAKLDRLLENIKSRTVRLYHGGTSIEAASGSATRHLMASIAAQYGDSGNSTYNLCNLGGSFEAAYNGWKKQPYGGMMFHRVRGESTSTALKFTGLCKRLVIRYSTEVGGGSCAVLVDGVAAGTIDCGGAQSFNNEFSLTFATNEVREITINPPASGFVYLEALDTCQDKPGLHVFDAAYGGSALKDFVTLRTATGAQVAGIALDSNVSIDSVFAKTTAASALDLAIVGWCVNDAGAGLAHVNGVYATALARIVALTKATYTPLILIIEMGGHYTLPVSGNHAAFERIRELMHSHSVEPHVTVIDWHSASRPDVIATWAARYYPSAVFNEATGVISSGDFIHPVQDGHAILSGMLGLAAGVATTGDLMSAAAVPAARAGRLTALPGAVSPQSPTNVTGTVIQRKNSHGLMHAYRCIGKSRPWHELQATTEALWYAATELNYETGINAAIAAAGTSDEYGPYKLFANTQSYAGIPEVNGAVAVAGIATLTVIVGQGAVLLTSTGYSGTPRVTPYVLGKQLTPLASGGYTYTNNTGMPQVLSLTFQQSAGLSVVLTGVVYGLYVTATEFACIPGRQIATARDLTVPLKVVGDIEHEFVIDGQTYLETVNGKTIERIATRGAVYKPLTGKFHALHRLADRTGISFQRLVPPTVSASAWDDRIGGYVDSTTVNPAYYTSPYVAVDNSKTYTLTGRLNDAANPQLHIGWYNAGGTWLYLQLDGSWATAEVNLGVKYSTTHIGATIAFTFTTPTLAQTGALPFTLRVWSGLLKGTPWTLCEGSAAIV